MILRKGWLWTIALASAVAVLAGCTLTPSNEGAIGNNAVAFVAAVEGKDSRALAGQLSQTALARVTPAQLTVTDGDFQKVAEVFRAASITARGSKPKLEPSVQVANLGGRPGTVTLVLHEEGGTWKIANVLISSATP